MEIGKVLVKPACGKARHCFYNFCLVYVHACVGLSVEICLCHNFYIYSWISELFGTVVVLEEEKSHLKHFSDRLKVKVTLEGVIN